MKHLDIKIGGRVQGVGFRYFCKHKAFDLGVTGYVKNIEDATVYVEAEGEERDLDKFVEWCYQGPDLASVEDVQVSEGKIQNYLRFRIRH